MSTQNPLGCDVAPVTAHELAAAIRAERDERISSGTHVLAINNGECEEFAYAVLDRLGGDEESLWERSRLWVMGAEDLCTELFGPFDPKALANHPRTVPPSPLSWDDMEQLGMSSMSHVWIVMGDRHYDSDVPDGVDNVFDLPLCRRNIAVAIQAAHPGRLAALASTNAWWAETLALHEEFQAWRWQAENRCDEPETTAPAPGR